MFAISCEPALPARHAPDCPQMRAACLLLRCLPAHEDCVTDCREPIIQLGAQWLHDQGLAPFAWYICRPASSLPADLLLALHTAYYAAVADAELHSRELSDVLQVLGEIGVTPVVFKGAALAHSVYPDPVCRPMGDLDLWLAADEIPRAQRALVANGYTPALKPDRPTALMILDMGEVRLWGSQPGAGLVELHWGVFPGEWLRRTAKIDEEAIRARTVAAQLVGQPARLQAPEDAVLQIVVHLAISHQLSLSALRGLVDIALIARAQPIEWTIVAQRARAWRIATATWLVMKLTVELAGLDEAAAIVPQLAPPALRRWLIDRIAPAESLVEMRELSRSRWRFVYLLLLVDRWRDAVRLVWRALWPEHEWLVARYNHSGPGVRLWHVWNAVRGRL